MPVRVGTGNPPFPAGPWTGFSSEIGPSIETDDNHSVVTWVSRQETVHPSALGYDSWTEIWIWTGYLAIATSHGRSPKLQENGFLKGSVHAQAGQSQEVVGSSSWCVRVEDRVVAGAPGDDDWYVRAQGFSDSGVCSYWSRPASVSCSQHLMSGHGRTRRLCYPSILRRNYPGLQISLSSDHPGLRTLCPIDDRIIKHRGFQSAT
ncbi:hypothetical protein HPB50_003694 [Hyalomma asiaticum]|uniref:Uncharacterized protein n=1 Tax=Hyalomma asiaticum TaxID=266040 RepID=A0ACB7SBW5_HYAAI|nr:hypothetical protein HPB50_003694 [Hyalomma asiaticum]